MTPEQQAEREKAIALLRSPSSWPEGFVWGFTMPLTCAIGLFRKSDLFPAWTPAYTYFADGLGLTYVQQCKIFSVAHADVRQIPLKTVTAEHVAAALEDPEAFVA